MPSTRNAISNLIRSGADKNTNVLPSYILIFLVHLLVALKNIHLLFLLALLSMYSPCQNRPPLGQSGLSKKISMECIALFLLPCFQVSVSK